MSSTDGNQYAHQLREAWATHRPRELAAMNDPSTFFRRLGERADEQIQRLVQQRTSSSTSASFLDNLGSLGEARYSAESEVMREMLPTPEDEE